MPEIQHNREAVEALINKMTDVGKKSESVETALSNLLNNIQAEFAGEAKESLELLLTNEIKKLQEEKENWQKLMKRAKNTADSFEEQDRSLAGGGVGGGGGGAMQPTLQTI